MRKERKGTFQEQDKEPVIARLAQLIRRHPSRSAAARIWGININTLNSYFKSESNPPMPRENLLSRIAESEGVSLEWLKTGLDESPKTPGITSYFGDCLSEMLSFLTQEERRQLASVLARKGVETVLYLLDEDNIRLLQLDRVVKAKILGMQSNAAAALNDERAKECGSDSEGGQHRPA
ncbi:MAG: hypothetical protein ACMZI0_01540 [Symbiopectobacterium sp.]|uniref:hypothetical protein n=1 Tax=Symbiopectobacterium sp. TaxID=2952789 RepID=UPI0039E8A23C